MPGTLSPCGSGLAREGIPSGNYSWPDTPLSRASSLPQGCAQHRDFVNTRETCRSGLAHEEAGTFNIDIA
ncbi:hypothetical protein C3E97_003070 [Pseudomonas sp. MWU12-2115]|nr:hypothetical protein C3E97_003070 [Pseudomonas sp. MWU12-2115]